MQKAILIVFSSLLMIMVGLSLYLMVGASPFARAQAFSDRASLLLENGEQAQAEKSVAHAIAINPYHVPFWSQLSYIAPEHRKNAIYLPSNLSRAAMGRRFEATRRLHESAIGEMP